MRSGNKTMRRDIEKWGASQRFNLSAYKIMSRWVIWMTRSPSPRPMASQARHESVAPKELCASRNVVPWGEGETPSVAGKICSVFAWGELANRTRKHGVRDRR
jgi:hypothetical protein